MNNIAKKFSKKEMIFKKIMSTVGICILVSQPLYGMDSPNDEEEATRARKISALQAYKEYSKQTDDIVYNAATIGGSIEAKYKVGLKIINKEATFTNQLNQEIQLIPFEEGRKLLMEVANYEPPFDGDREEIKINREYKAKAQKYFQAYPNPLTQNIVVKNIHRFLDTNMFYGYAGMIFISGASFLVNMKYGSNYSPSLDSFNRVYLCLFNSVKTIHSSTQYALTGHRDDLLESLSNALSTVDHIYEYMKLRRLSMIEKELLDDSKTLEYSKKAGDDYEKEKEDCEKQISLIDQEKKDVEDKSKKQNEAISAANTAIQQLSAQKELNSSHMQKVEKELKEAESYYGVTVWGWKPEDYIEKDSLKKYKECKVANPRIDKEISNAQNKCVEAQKETSKLSKEYDDIRHRKLEKQSVLQDLLRNKVEADFVEATYNRKVEARIETKKKVEASGKIFKSLAVGAETTELMKNSDPIERSIIIRETECLGNISGKNKKAIVRSGGIKGISLLLDISTRVYHLMPPREKIFKVASDARESISSCLVFITGFIKEDVCPEGSSLYAAKK